MALMAGLLDMTVQAQSRLAPAQSPASTVHVETLLKLGITDAEATKPATGDPTNVTGQDNGIPVIGQTRRNDERTWKAWIKSFLAWKNATPDYTVHLDAQELSYVTQSMWESLYQYHLNKDQHPSRSRAGLFRIWVHKDTSPQAKAYHGN